MEFNRWLDLTGDSQKKSLFLFGPRQTGKTHLLKKLFPDSPFYNLLLADVFLKLSQRPQILREEILAQRRPVLPIIIDEIQKLPGLLDEVQFLIEEKKARFILTGSSARKLKRGGANLLGGRAWTRHLFPLTTAEIPHYDLLARLNQGALPPIVTSSDPEQDLNAYVGTYLKEEIQAEGLTRKIGNFSRFLQTAALSNGQLLNFTAVGSDAGVPQRTVVEYFSILEDTRIGHLLPPFRKTKTRKAVATSKFYFFDVGVCNHLAGRKNIRPKTDLFGNVLEHFIFTEILACLDYHRDDRPLTFWRSHSGYEVDFLIGDEIGIEVKGTDRAADKHLAGLRAMADDIKLKRKIVVTMDPAARRVGDIEILPVKKFLAELWATRLHSTDV